MIGFSHFWIEIDGSASIHFSGNADIWEDPGIVEVNTAENTTDNIKNDKYVQLPDNGFFKGRGKSCEKIRANPCNINISTFKQVIIGLAYEYQKNPPNYNWNPGSNCEGFAVSLLHTSNYALSKDCGL